MLNIPRGRTITAMELCTNNDQKSIVLKLDDGSELVIKETGGPGADSNWYTYPEISWQKDGKALARWTL